MGSGNMRAQLSLLFTDEELYKNFIVPMKNGRMLHSIILKCLTAYYYNPEVRSQIEGIEINNTSTDGEVHISNQQESINEIRNLLTMQSFMTQELSNSMEDGIDEMGDILDQVNKRAEDRGFTQTKTNEYGSTVFRIAVKDSNNSAGDSVSEQDLPTVEDVTNSFQKMQKIIGLFEKSGMLEQLQASIEEDEKMGTNDTFADDVEDVGEPVEEPVTEVEEKPIEKPKTKKPTVKKGKKPVVEEVEETPTEPEVEEVNVGEAKASIDELLGSL